LEIFPLFLFKTSIKKTLSTSFSAFRFNCHLIRFNSSASLGTKTAGSPFSPQGKGWGEGDLLVMINKIALKVNPALERAIHRISIEIWLKIIYVDIII
jgi:hypothetical protein